MYFTFTFTFTEVNFLLQDYTKNRTHQNSHVRKAFNLQRLTLRYNIKMILTQVLLIITEMKRLGVGISEDTVCKTSSLVTIGPLFVQVRNYHLQYTINCVTMSYRWVNLRRKTVG